MATVLVVGHEPDLANVVRWLLEEEGHAVVHAVDGEAALVMLRTSPQAMIVVLLTTRPHVHTVDILEAALEESAVKRHAFVLFTAVAEFLPMRWQELISLLAIPVLAKPLGISHVSGTVADIAARLGAPR